MVTTGELAPEFSLPGVADDSIEQFSLEAPIEREKAVLLLFFPFDFSPVCTNELCAIRDVEWFQFTSDLDVWAVSADSVYAHRAFAEEYDLDFPLLSDSSGRVAEAYDVCYDEWENHERVPKRSVFLIDGNCEVRYAWQTDDAFEKPDFFPVKAALDELAEERDDLGADEVEFTVEYGEGPGKRSNR